jgi:transglutaminase-like putative cysteine protease
MSKSLTIQNLTIQNMKSRIPLYIAGFCLSCTALLAVNSVHATTYPAILLCILTGFGFSLSWATRAGLLTKNASLKITYVIIAGFIVWNISKQHFNYAELQVTSTLWDSTLTLLLSSIIVIESFILLSDKSVLFTCVPSLSLLILAATFSMNMKMLLKFAVYIAFICFILAQQNVLYRLDKHSTRSKGLKFHSITSQHVTFSVVIASISLLISSAVAKYVYPYTSRFAMGELLETAIVSTVPRFAEKNFVPVATGPIVLNDQVVMTVKCPEERLWRGQTFNLYTGNGWTSDIPPEEWKKFFPIRETNCGIPEKTRYLLNDKHVYQTLSSPQQRVKTRYLKQYFRILSYERTSVLFAAAEPVLITANLRGSITQVGGGYQASEYLGWGTSYQVDSIITEPTPHQLRSAPKDIPESIRSRYLSVPQSCWKIKHLVRQITAGQHTAFDKARAIEEYLKRHYIYDPKAPPVPREEDAVTFFLLKSKRGYCDLFASAMVIMARQAGIPARWVTGFAPGKYDPSTKTFQVRNKDAHAWAELYFPGYGWIEFDPTPSDTTKPNILDQIQAVRQWLKAASLSGKQIMILILTTTTLLLTLLKLKKLEDIIRRKPQHSLSSASIGTPIPKYYYKMCSSLAGIGYPKNPASTPLEYAQELRSVFQGELSQILEPINSLTSTFVEWAFSGRELPKKATEHAEEEFTRFLYHFKNIRKRKLLRHTKEAPNLL